MSRREESIALRHMRDYAAEALAHAHGRSRADLDTDRLFALGMTRLVEVIGEAAGRISQATRDAHLNIPWKQIVGTRNRLIHGYDEIDLDVLWRIASVELPPLVEQLESILADAEKAGS